MKSHVASIALLTLVVTGCSADAARPEASAEPTPQAPEPSAPSEAQVDEAPIAEKKLGRPIGDGAVTSLAAIASEPAKFAGQTVRTEGVVTAVCKAAGCWMEIGDDAGLAHVKMANHSFYVPRNADGRRARVEGTVQAGAPKDECGAKDSCGGAQNGALAKLEIEATGVELLD